MEKKDFIHFSKIIENITKTQRVSRREALKLLGAASLSAMFGKVPLKAGEEKNSVSKAKARIIIVGAGTGGVMAAARLRQAVPNAEIIVIAPNETHLYQPGQVFIAAGLYTEEEIKKPNSKLLPEGVRWIKDKVCAFDPDADLVETARNGKIKYDFLVVATGLQYNYEGIEGMRAELVGQNGIASVYLNDIEKGTARGGALTWRWFGQLRAAAQKKSEANPLNVIYTQPDTPIKCGGAPQKILYLSNDFLRGNGPGGGSDIHRRIRASFCKSGSKLFGLQNYNRTLVEDVCTMYGNIDNRWNHVLRKIDPQNKIATFEHISYSKGEYDPDLEEYDMVSKKEKVEMEYDFIHVVPPMKAVDIVANSPLGWQKGTAKGWLACDRYTLQHIKYKNVFGVGDILGIPLGKTGGSTRYQAAVVQENLTAAIKGEDLQARFDGYTVCPLKTQYGKIMLAEFNYDGEASSFPFDPSIPRGVWWAFDLYILKPLYWSLMMRGMI